MSHHAPLGLLFALVMAAVPQGSVSAEDGPRFARLEVFPAKLELGHVRDARRLLVTGVTEDGLRFDLTPQARFQPAADHVAIDRDGYVVPKQAGETTITVSAGGLVATVPVVVKDVSDRPVSFVREVIPIISKVGCNAGTCHGSANGKAGFKLSLRGYDTLFDYTALVDDISGRRFNRAEPGQSLMLLKPTQAVPHEGGFLFDEESRPYELIRQWIAEGCRYEDQSRVASLSVHPEKPVLQSTENGQQLVVLAHYDDGSLRDVTREAVFETSNFEVATVSATGLVDAVRRGEAAALVRYEGQYAAAPVTVIGDREGYVWKSSPEFNYIDGLVNKKLQRTKLLPSDLCTDAEFLRRVSIDLTGLPPTADEVRAFLADERDTRTKRQEKIDELFASPAFVDHWTLKWSDLLLSNRKSIKEKGVWGFRNWIRHSIAVNKPYDQFARELMTASGSSFENPAANYYRIAREPKEVMENMTQVFLGTRFNCNQCHDHPFERWTQQQYYELSGYFAGVGRKPGIAADDEIIVSLRQPATIEHPNTGEAVEPKFPFEHEGTYREIKNPRRQLAEWLTDPKNPYFARSIVNRYWSYFFGIGIIEPVDDIRASNPPSNPELLDALEKDFIEHGFDLKRLVRTIVSSHSYQRSFRPNEWNEDDALNFSHAQPRRLTAEELFDAIKVASGAPTDLPGVPKGFHATQLPDPEVDVPFLDMFGRAPRESPCECERTSTVSLAQTLSLVNGPLVAESIAHPQGRIATAAAAGKSSEELIEDVYLAALCRYPTDAERAEMAEYFTT
ncbi:MAG: DUF1553 domain-containing protein, partial [Planctomycetaceae bacterium]